MFTDKLQIPDEPLRRSKILIPTPKDNRMFAVKLCIYYHIKHKCTGVTYLSQTFSQYFHVQNIRTICSLAFNLCHVCLIRRLIKQKCFVKEPIYTYPKKCEISIEPNSLQNSLNSSWEIDFITHVKIHHIFCHFAEKTDKKLYEIVHKSRIF